jgi:uncharacterized protein YgbK (DUF1537 family)
MGIVADDLTGAADVASVVAADRRTVLLRSSPIDGPGSAPVTAPSADVLVTGLRIRTAPPGDAARAALTAAQGMLEVGTPLLYSKYCSTFDSTDTGNIGPIADVLADLVEERCVVVCPAYPSLGRTVVDGRLLVHGVPLEQTAMAHHPLTPMTDSDLRLLLSRQTDRAIATIPLSVIRSGDGAFRAARDRAIADGARYAIVDAEHDGDLAVIASGLDGARLATGSAGLAGALAARRAGSAALATPPPGPEDTRDAVASTPIGPLIVLAGSSSAATLAQVARFRPHHPTLHIAPQDAVDDPEQLADQVTAWVQAQGDVPALLIHASAPPDEVRDVQARLGAARVAQALETSFGAVARRLVDRGAGRLLVAGGETSGAVLEALGHPVLRVATALCPGVPWLRATVGRRHIAIALKSGNFGPPDLFLGAIGSAP